MRVVHVITGLGTGGAETTLVRLLAALPREEFASSVVSLMDRGRLGDRIADLGVEVLELGLTPPLPSWGAFIRLRRLLRDLRPDLVQGWLYHGNLAATLATSRRRGRGPVVCWNIRGAVKGARGQGVPSRAVTWLGARLSRRPAAIVYNSSVAVGEHARLGFRNRRAVVIANGFDTDAFRPGAVDRAEARRLFALPAEDLIVGVVARWHPQKDHATFLRAAAELAARAGGVSFALAGPGLDEGNAELGRLLAGTAVGGRVRLLGEVGDVPWLLAALDVLCLPSAWGEGFPNVVGEAMACGVPCVVTDVGDSAAVLGGAGRVVQPGDARALATALTELIESGPEERRRLGARGRKRVEERYSLAAAAAAYAELYRGLVATTGR